MKGLTKDFKKGFWIKRPFRALDDLHLSVKEGEVFGFLGPNGAGKTTTLKILMRLIYPTAGEAKILGKPIQDVDTHKEIGFLPESPYFYDHLTAEECLHYAAHLFGYDRSVARRKVHALLELVGLVDSKRVPMRKFSKGMVQRIGLAQALINDPKVVFFDEPMSGLDPIGRREVREIVVGLKNKGVTIFFSSHILSDVESLCDRVAILNKGRLLDCGGLNEILRMEVSSLEVIVAGIHNGGIEAIRKASRHLEQLGDRIRILIPDDRTLDQILPVVRQCQGKLISVNPIRESLEDFFLKRIGNKGSLPT